MSTTSQGSLGALAKVQDYAEELIYRLNERDHWIFRAYDAANELFATIRYRGLRERASALDQTFSSRGGATGRIRFLHPRDEETFAELCAAFDSRYVPPHPIDRESAARALRRNSYLPFGIFLDDRLVGYLLVRLFLPGRGVTGIWTLPETWDKGIGQSSLRITAAFTRSEGLPDYATIPIDNPNSLRMANAAGWNTIRTNRRFHVLLLDGGRASDRSVRPR